MTTSKRSNPLNSRWLKTFVLLGALIVVPFGIASAKDEKANAGADLEAIGKKLKAAVKSGELTEEQAIAKYKAATGKVTGQSNPKGKPEKDRIDLDALGAQLKAAVKSGKLTEEQAIAKYQAVAAKQKSTLTPFEQKLKTLVKEGKLTTEEALELYESVTDSNFKVKTVGNKKKQQIYPHKVSLAQAKELSKILPTTSTAGDKEGPVATGFFGWAANATQRFMDNSHKGKPRKIHGMSFRLDHRDHDTIGRTWEKVTIRIAHGDWSSIKYNAAREFKLTDQAVVTFDKKWSFPTLKGYPALEPAAWGGPQNCLSFRFDKPFEYNGKDAIFVEFVFSGGKAVDGREWKGDLPYGFEYFIDSMPESGGWRVAERPQGIYRAPRVEAVTSYTAGGQSVWTSSPKGMPYIKWDFKK